MLTRRSLVASLQNLKRPGQLVQNAIALMISSGGGAVIGVVFWGVAAHLTSATSVGKTTAEIAAMLLLANLAQLSFGSIFERFLPVAGPLTRSFVIRAYVMVVTLGFLLVIAYVAFGFGRNFLPASITWKALFVVAVVLWTIFALQDSVLIGLRASRWVAVENVSFGLAKLALLPACIFLTSTQGIFLAWTAPVVVTIILVSWYLFKRRIPEHMAMNVASEGLPSTRDLVLLAGAQYTTVLSTVFMPSITTLIVIQRLGAVANAHYFLPAMIASGLNLFCYSVVRSFLVEASHEPESLRHHANSAIRALIVVVVPSVVLGIVFAPQYLRIFGSDYATQGTTLMRLLLLSLPGTTVMIFYSTFAWLDKRVWWMTIRSLAGSVIQLVVIVLLIDRRGIEAIGIATLLNSMITIILFLPMAVRRYRLTAVNVGSDQPDGPSTPDA